MTGRGIDATAGAFDYPEQSPQWRPLRDFNGVTPESTPVHKLLFAHSLPPYVLQGTRMKRFLGPNFGAYIVRTRAPFMIIHDNHVWYRSSPPYFPLCDGSLSCQDRVRRCAELNVSQDCSQDIYKVFCGKKCGLCNDCEDADFCPRSASAAECQDQTVRNDCAKSCGAC
ncbi:hypothetical protein Tcan_08803 [Toxocara canis]|uniref:ShKT domain-containing protein n=2 Tax=Toxocara canis TaxID=6265 RepID=A0A0B2VXK6_TOXCA|nr:hypothetical protein Tcan_08803 [Toxocara canis]VDM38205.1 unnamed protein product [Toxocara canis]